MREATSEHACQALNRVEYSDTGERVSRWTCTCGASGEADTTAQAANDWHAHVVQKDSS